MGLFYSEGMNDISWSCNDQQTRPDQQPCSRPQSQLGKRERALSIIGSQDDDWAAKRCRVADLLDLYEDFIAKRNEANVAEALWRSARESLQCIKSPKSTNPEGI